jgi:anti-anti-sigma regulatory factor
MEITVTTIEAGTIRPRWLQERAEIEIIVPPVARISAPITILHLQGSLEGSSYETLLDVIQQQGDLEQPRVILDFANVDYISNSGLLGLYMAGCLLDGQPIHDLDGYEVTGYMRNAIEERKPLPNLHLAALSDDIESVLESTGFATMVSTYPSVDDAISDFPTL